MARKENQVQTIVRLIAKRFPSLFTAGTGIEELVRFILAKRKALEYAQRQKIGNDARDISYASGLLKPLSDQSLGIIGDLNQREIRQRLSSKVCPFSGLSKETREKLWHLPISWIHEGAQWQLKSRKLAIQLYSSLLR